jgi:nitrite reductase/ring-hydroxylating ferredoxin subunit
MAAVRVAALADVAPGQPRRVELSGTPIVLTRIGEQVYACGDTCAHKGGPLSDGKLTGARLACPWHGWMFDVRTGECLFPGRGARVPTYPVSIEDGEVFVQWP